MSEKAKRISFMKIFNSINRINNTKVKDTESVKSNRNDFSSKGCTRGSDSYVTEQCDSTCYTIEEVTSCTIEEVDTSQQDAENLKKAKKAMLVVIKKSLEDVRDKMIFDSQKAKFNEKIAEIDKQIADLDK